jgi:hypothetical protein
LVYYYISIHRVPQQKIRLGELDNTALEGECRIRIMEVVEYGKRMMVQGVLD